MFESYYSQIESIRLEKKTNPTGKIRYSHLQYTINDCHIVIFAGNSYGGMSSRVLVDRNIYILIITIIISKQIQRRSAGDRLYADDRCSSAVRRRRRRRRWQRPGVVRPPTRRPHWSGRGLGAHLLGGETH